MNRIIQCVIRTIDRFQADHPTIHTLYHRGEFVSHELARVLEVMVFPKEEEKWHRGLWCLGHIIARATLRQVRWVEPGQSGNDVLVHQPIRVE